MRNPVDEFLAWIAKYPGTATLPEVDQIVTLIQEDEADRVTYPDDCQCGEAFEACACRYCQNCGQVIAGYGRWPHQCP